MKIILFIRSEMNKCRLVIVLSSLLVPFIFAGCGSSDNGGGIVDPPAGESYWDNYLDAGGNPITLPSGFKLSALAGVQRKATAKTTPAHNLAYLNFAVDPDYRSHRGWLFRGHDQSSSDKQDIAGAVEFVKQGGWLRTGETFDWDSSTKKYNQPPELRMTFIGWAGDLMITYLSEPYIGYPADESKTWTGKPIYVSDGGGNELVEILSYKIVKLGTCKLVEKTGSGSRTLETYDDVIRIEGRANEGQGKIDAYLAPNVGIIYYHLVTAFGQEGAAALIGFSGANQTLGGSVVTDYFPTAPGNHWIYEFSPDDHVPEFRFSIE